MKMKKKKAHFIAENAVTIIEWLAIAVAAGIAIYLAVRKFG